MEYKHLILFPIPDPFSWQIERLMDRVAKHTKIPPPSEKLVPHVSFHPPLKGVEEKVLLSLVESMSLQVKASRITVHRLTSFGKHYIVLPVQATLRVAKWWTGINDLLKRLPEYEHSEFDEDNTLHISIAAKTSEVFDEVWPNVRNFDDGVMNIPMEKVEVHRKPLEGGKWERIAEFPLLPNVG